MMRSLGSLYGPCHLGIAAQLERLQAVSLPWPRPHRDPETPVCCPRAYGSGRLGWGWGVSGCSPCFQLTFQNGLSLAVGRQQGRGGLQHPREQGPCLAASRSPSFLSLYNPAALPCAVLVLGALCSKGGLQRNGPRALSLTCLCWREDKAVPSHHPPP